MAAVAAAQAQEAVGQDAAFEESVELVFDELRQVGAGSVFGLGEEGCGVLLHQAVQRGPKTAPWDDAKAFLEARARGERPRKPVARKPAR